MLFILPIPCVYCCCCCCVEAWAAELWAEGAVEVIGVSAGVPLLVVLSEDSVLSLESFFADWRRFFSGSVKEKVFFFVFWSGVVVVAEASAPVGEEGASLELIERVFFFFSSPPNVGMRRTQEGFFFQTANKSGKKKSSGGQSSQLMVEEGQDSECPTATLAELEQRARICDLLRQ